MTVDYYGDLGVDSKATPDEIRAAYRRAASEHHPDREGGDAERMQRVNRANEVLSDPERRAHYDRTGSDRVGRTPAKMAVDLLRSAFSAVIDSPTPLDAARKRLTETGETIKRKKREAARVVMSLSAKRDLLRVKAGENLFREVLDGRIEALGADMAMADEAVRVHEIALDLLAGYESSEGGTDAAIEAAMAARWAAAYGPKAVGK